MIDQSSAVLYNENRKNKYQAFRVAGIDYEGLLKDKISNNNLLNTSFPDQIKYLHLDSISFKGKTVLDIGCNIGAIAIEISRRNPKQVYAIDTNPVCIKEAKELLLIVKNLESLSVNVNFYVNNYIDMGWNDSADITVFMAMLHHYVNPMRALSQLSNLTKALSILEVQVSDNMPFPHKQLDNLDFTVKRKYPQSKFGVGYYPTTKALVETLNLVGFKKVQLIGEGKIPSRVVIHAHK